MKPHKHYIVITQHNVGSDLCATVRHKKIEAIEYAHDFFLGYGFEIRNGKPFDPANDDGINGGFNCFDNVTMNGGKVLTFMHCGGDGPVCSIQED